MVSVGDFVDKKYKVGDIVKGVVSGLENYGIFMSFDDDYTGLIHISEISDHFVSDITKYATIGDIIPCYILEVDDENKKIKGNLKNTSYGIEKDALIDHGFGPLKKQLPIWMENELKKIDKE